MSRFLPTSPITRTVFGILFVALAALTSSIYAKPAAAVSGSDWKAGHIIDDAVFYNKNSMSVDQIQQFLNAKNPNCDNWGTQSYAVTTRRAYSEARGIKFPLTCLKDYYENTSTLDNNLTQTDGQTAPIPSGAKSAAQIIWEAAQQYNINPQVLLVLLQKEQILVQDDWPWPIQYQGATGYGCPDGAPCSTQYYGFYNQITNAAYQFRRYADNSNQYNYVPGNNYIQWNPTSSCGGSTVSILNQATASLYNYTPYQPNQAALDNISGTGDSCSSYGNRNFWRYFTDWFGSTLVSFIWQNNGYTMLDETESNYVDPNHLMPGKKYIVKLAALNTGSAVWSNNGPTPFTLATADAEGHSSSLCYSSWLSCSRPTYLQEPSVSPGQIGNFKFMIQAPLGVGSYTEYFKPVAELLAWSNDTSQPFQFTVNPGSYTWQSHGYRVQDATESTYIDPGQLQPGQKYVASLTVTNTGTATWTNNGPTPVTLGTSSNSFLCNPTWLACNRPAYLQEASVAPGQTGHFKFTFWAPYAAGHYWQHFTPLAEFASWMSGDDDSLGIVVQSPGTYQWQNLTYRVLDQAEANYIDPGQLHAGQKYIIKLAALNTGTATWTNSGPTPVTLGTTNPEGHSSFLCYSSWLTCSRPAYLQEPSVAPGQIGNFKFMIQAPSTPGSYREFFTPLAEMFTWFQDSNESLGIQVH